MGYLRYIFAIRNILAHQSPTWREGWVRYDRIDTARDITKREALIYVATPDELANLSEFTQLLRWSLMSIDLNEGHEEQSAQYFQEAMTLFETLPLPAHPGK
jgi:hypothetical protein